MALDFLKTAPGADPIIVEAWLPAEPTRVFDAWTEVDKLTSWFGYTPNSAHEAAIDLRIGGSWKVIWKQEDETLMGFTGAYHDLRRPNHLGFSWQQIKVDLAGQEDRSGTSKVDIAFLEEGRGTNIHLRHTGVTSEEARQGIGGGWNMAFGNLTTLFPAP